MIYKVCNLPSNDFLKILKYVFMHIHWQPPSRKICITVINSYWVLLPYQFPFLHLQITTSVDIFNKGPEPERISYTQNTLFLTDMKTYVKERFPTTTKLGFQLNYKLSSNLQNFTISKHSYPNKSKQLILIYLLLSKEHFIYRI